MYLFLLVNYYFCYELQIISSVSTRHDEGRNAKEDMTQHNEIITHATSHMDILSVYSTALYLPHGLQTQGSDFSSLYNSY